MNADATGGDAQLPSLVCEADRIPLTSVPADADVIATTLVAGGFVVLIEDTQNVAFPTGVQLDAQRQPIVGPKSVAAIAGSRLGSLVDLGSMLYAVSSRGGSDSDHYLLGHDLATYLLRANRTELLGRDCAPATQIGGKRAYLAAAGALIQMYFVDGTGALGTGNTYQPGGALTEVACSDGPDHVHVAWANASGSCAVGAALMTGPQFPTWDASMTVSTDCHTPRITNGSPVTDDGLLAWKSSTGTVESVYGVSSSQTPVQLSPSGRAPKVSFDGTRFWAAWIDTRGGRDELYVGSAAPGGAFTSVPVTGWTPVGDEAFELVRDGATIYLVVVEATSLSFLRVCS